MADYSNFPFDNFSIDEIAEMMMQSVLLGDDEFAVACREQIKRRRTDECICGYNPETGYRTDILCPVHDEPKKPQ